MTVIAFKRAELRFEPVLPTDLKGVWPHIVRDVAIVAKRSRSSWVPEHVFSAIFNGHAALYVVYQGTTYAGLVVTNVLLDVFSGEKALGVWLCYSRLPGAVDEGLPELDDIARSLGCSTIKMQSPRKGWIRRLLPYGYKIRDYVLEKVLVDG